MAKKPAVKKPAVKKAAKVVKASVLSRIRKVVAKPQPKAEKLPVARDPLISPLPTKEVKNFGEMPFESQAKLLFSVFPADEGEVIGKTNNSGAGSIATPEIVSS